MTLARFAASTVRPSALAFARASIVWRGKAAATFELDGPESGPVLDHSSGFDGLSGAGPSTIDTDISENV